VGTICIVTAPLLLYSALHGGIVPKAAATLVVLVVATIQSRSTLAIFWLEFFVLLLVLRKGLTFFAMNVVATGLVFMLVRPTLSAKAPTALLVDTFYLDDMLSGRIGFLWVPLLREWMADPVRLLWGAGRYGILVSAHFATGGILQATHAHNAFIDLFLDAGLIGVVVVVLALAAGFSRAWRVGRSIRDPMFWALALCLCGYLAGTVTERGFFPSYDNLLVFPVLALLVNVARLRTTGIAAPAT
jgi:O-antigen ligase